MDLNVIIYSDFYIMNLIMINFCFKLILIT